MGGAESSEPAGTTINGTSRTRCGTGLPQFPQNHLANLDAGSAYRKIAASPVSHLNCPLSAAMFVA
jgi:hypothetical protein